MYVHCPGCKTCYRLKARHLAVGHGEVYCARCNQLFDALDHLSDEIFSIAISAELSASRIPVLGHEDAMSGLMTEQRQPAEKKTLETAEDSEEHWFSRLGWLAGNVVLTMMLCLQFAYMLLYHQANEEGSRPWIEKLCVYAHCKLPPFHDVTALQIMARQLRPITTEKQGYELLLVFANQASLPQSLPKIRLTLMDKAGHPIAQRIFSPREYLTPPLNAALMPPGKPYEIRLQVSRTVRDVGGFTFVLI